MISSRSQALPGTALPCRLCLPNPPRRDFLFPATSRGRASTAVRSQAEPGTEGNLGPRGILLSAARLT